MYEDVLFTYRDGQLLRLRVPGQWGKEIFKALLQGCFAQGGLQHRPNVPDVQTLDDARRHPENDPDLIVLIWGVSAHFVKLPKELQDEMIARLA